MYLVINYTRVKLQCKTLQIINLRNFATGAFLQLKDEFYLLRFAPIIFIFRLQKKNQIHQSAFLHLFISGHLEFNQARYILQSKDIFANWLFYIELITSTNIASCLVYKKPVYAIGFIILYHSSETHSELITERSQRVALLALV